MCVARVGQVRSRSGGVSHGHERYAEMCVRMHGKSKPKRAAKLTERLHLPQAAPIVRVAENDLDRAGLEVLGQIREGSNGHVTCERRRDAGSEQTVAHFGHAGNACGGIFQVAAIREFFLQQLSDVERGGHGPSAIGVHAERDVWTETIAKLLDGLDFDVRIEDASLELDVAESVFRDQLLRLPHERFWTEHFSILVRAGVGAFATAACVLVEGISGERNFIASTATEEVADRFANGFSNEIQRSDFQGGVEAG